jgi:SPX domain protein involved in polyphosphate accumulation
MKYGEYLRTHLTPEWSSQYLSYEDMKDMLTNVMNKIDRNLSRQQYFLLADEEFLQVRNMFFFSLI